MTNVCMIIHSFYPLIGGAETYAQELGERLVKAGNKVTVITIRYQGLKPKENINGIDVVRIYAPNIRGLRFLFYSCGLIFHAIKNRKKIDVIHSYQTFTAGFLGAIMGKILRKPTVLREGAESLTLLKDSKNPIKRPIMKFTAKATDEIYPISPKLVPIFRDLGRETEFIWNPVDSSMFKPKIKKSKKFTVLYLGRLAGFKNVKCLLEAVPLLSEIPNLEIVVAGYGPCEEELKQQAKKLGISVRFTGKVPFEETPKYYQEADVFVHPALSIPGPPFPSNTVLQAMASGLPIVSSKDHMIKPGIGIAVEPYNELIAKAVIMLYKNPELRAKLGKAGRKAALALSWEEHMKRLFKIYWRVL